MGDMSLHFSSASEHWLTPLNLLESAAFVFGGEIDLDPCADLEKMDNVPARIRWTVLDDCLTKNWAGYNAWMNPPYGRTIKKFVSKAAHESYLEANGNTIALLPSRTDTSWFQPLFDFPICFVRGRLKFKNVHLPSYNPSGDFKMSPAPFPSAIIYIGRNTDMASAFRKEFSQYGRIVG